ncbi:hypothetical protein HK100_010006 [Physocladia obscura]|uniref:Uncharacterized protein n=1 Tax=Physocladia obscura TaxID=109957 RepID=A0AAD5T8W4_9FUNG|nr:hypothetical protein HK100_010006 [Physocladia obscura]
MPGLLADLESDSNIVKRTRKNKKSDLRHDSGVSMQPENEPEGMKKTRGDSEPNRHGRLEEKLRAKNSIELPRVCGRNKCVQGILRRDGSRVTFDARKKFKPINNTKSKIKSLARD